MDSREWQPIETVPKNGTPVLLWWPLGSFLGVVARWPIGARGWEVTWNGEKLSRLRHEPTHWMPLPLPPGDTSNG